MNATSYTVQYATLTDADARTLAEMEINAFGFVPVIQYIRYQWWPMIEEAHERMFAARVLAIVEREYTAYQNRQALLASIIERDALNVTDATNKRAILAHIANHR